MSLFVCEISGETATSSEQMVVTPSGHVCTKRLLVAKLRENGGVDPFNERTLHEDDLIPLATSSSSSSNKSIIPPPRPTASTSYTHMLELLQTEYDAVVLELFDTRQALQSTRQELSQSLYQHDAAMRVIARLLKEKDLYKSQLMELQVSGVATSEQVQQQESLATKRHHEEETAAAALEQPSAKKQKTGSAKDDDADASAIDQAQLPLDGNIPDSDLTQMVTAWQGLHQGRKAIQKIAAAAAPSVEQLNSLAKDVTVAMHKTSCKQMTAMTVASASGTAHIVTAGADKQVLCYDAASKAVVWSIPKTQASYLSYQPSSSSSNTGAEQERPSVLATGHGKLLSFYNISSSGDVSNPVVATTLESIVSVQLHPDKNHVMVGTLHVLLLYRIQTAAANDDEQDDASLVHVSSFGQEEDGFEMTCGCLHPDGLIYICGTSDGNLQIWDLKNKCLGGTLVAANSSDSSSSVTHVGISENGYHIASTNASGVVTVWDLRKQAIVATLNDQDEADRLESVSSTSFDPSGKYLAYGGSTGLRVCMVKEWKIKASYEIAADYLGWAGAATIVAAGKKGRLVHLLE
ncbi:hypothetical protein MPSEU_000118600 [Mayamaea pseudoterrestris]|nr:hypothetical protein MPSEU_000118600 [Mayamaea pseudoterrestris]